MTGPPGNSLQQAQDGRVADPGEDLAAGLRALLERIGEEVDFNDAKGRSAYRLGVHDGLRFAEDAVAELLTRHGSPASVPGRAADA